MLVMLSGHHKIPNLAIRTSTNVFCTERFFITCASPSDRTCSCSVVSESRHEVFERTGVDGVSDEDTTRSDKLVCLGRMGSKVNDRGTATALSSLTERKSVYDLELPSLRCGGLRVVLSGKFSASGLYNARGESIDDRPDVGLFTFISTGAFGETSFSELSPAPLRRFFREGQTYSMMS
jgi:hypothetical protein